MKAVAIDGKGKEVAQGCWKCSAPVLLGVLHQLSLPGKTMAI